MKQYIKKILIFVFICISFFLADTLIVNAASVGAFGGLNINSSKLISGNNGYSTGQGYYVTQSSNAKNFIEYTFCLTDVLDFYTISVSGSIAGDPVTVAYPKTSCQINNTTTGFIEKVYVNVLSYADAGNGNLGITLDSSIFNRHNYSVYAKLIAVSTVDSIVYDNTSEIIDQNQTIIDQNQQTNENLDNIEDSILDSNIDDDSVSSTFEDFNNFLDDNSTITQLITLPITLYTAILNNVGSTCRPFSLGSFYGEELVLPCVNPGNYLGSTLWGMIDLIISGFAIYAISKKLIKIFNTFSSMKEGDVIDD